MVSTKDISNFINWGKTKRGVHIGNTLEETRPLLIQCFAYRYEIQFRPLQNSKVCRSEGGMGFSGVDSGLFPLAEEGILLGGLQ